MCEFVVLFAYRANLGIESVLSMQLENSGPKARRKRKTFRKIHWPSVLRLQRAFGPQNSNDMLVNLRERKERLLKSKTLKLAQESIDFWTLLFVIKETSETNKQKHTHKRHALTLYITYISPITNNNNNVIQNKSKIERGSLVSTLEN